MELRDPTQRPEPDEGWHCAFCDYRGKALTGEHVWPERFEVLFPGIQLAKHQRGTLLPEVQLSTWDAPPFSTKVPIDCARCNSDILRTIEREALRYIQPMALGAGVGGVPITARQKLAAFALRMFSVGQYTHPSARPIPRHHRELLISDHAPPLRAEVWAWAHSGTDISAWLQAGAAQVMWPGEAVPLGANSYRGILRIGHLVLEMAARTDGQTFPLIPSDRDAFLRLWPLNLSDILIWPPKHLLSEADWNAHLATLVSNIDLIAR